MRNKTCKYYGVYFNGRKYIAKANVNKIYSYIGQFDNVEDAAVAYDSFVKENKLNRRINFPEPEPENLIPNTRLIRLTQGKFAVVDEEDYEYLNQFNWSVRNSHRNWYAFRVVNKKEIKMHRIIINAPNDFFVDHKNGDGLHNYKSNLRLATIHQNNMNATSDKNTITKLKGVRKEKNCKSYRSIINFNKIAINLGSFKSPEEAGIAYDNAAIKYFGEFARLNFPERQKQLTA